MSRLREEELTRVYREHVGAVFAFFAYSVSTETAEDLTAGTFERVIRGWETFDPRRASPRTWILAIARNLLTDHHRRQHHRVTISTDEPPALLERLAGADARVDRREQPKLREWLAPLGERERQVLALRFAADLSTPEIGVLMDLTPANVQQILSRTLRRLREE